MAKRFKCNVCGDISPVELIERITLEFSYGGKPAGEIDTIICPKCGVIRKLPDV
ncbi:MAG: hypothetical protein GY853_15920 [PVC group bacterium]|nr:hypothetical protein [PVC group bacterium]